MILSRIDLCDLRSPEAVARGVLGQIAELAPPVPVTEIAEALGISRINVGSFDGFEGMLLTDRVRSRGGILANDSRGRPRARFTIAHELGHFLMEWHELSAESGFQCRSSDMRETREDRQDRKQEAQANRFAIDLLAPQVFVDRLLSRASDLRDAQRLRDALDISLEAAVRRMIDCRDEALAAVFSKDGCVRYTVRGDGFPWIDLKKGDPLPRISAAHRAVANAQPGFTELVETPSIAWTSRQDVGLWEQSRVGGNGTAITLLEADVPDVDDADDGGLAELGQPRFR